jgi:putative membrane protein
VSEATAEKRPSKILILCVDRDDDLRVKAGVNAPVIGRDANIQAATKLAVKDPEEADANAIFEAIRIFDTVSPSAESKGESYEVATITGSQFGGIEADKELTRQLDETLRIFKADSAILVTDGFADESVIPVIQSRLPLLSVRRIVVKHSESIEETAAIFSRYMKKIVEEPRYSRWFLGVPGILLIILAILWYYDLLIYGGIASLIILGTVMLIHGFGIDRKIASWALPGPLEQLRALATIAGLILIAIGIFQAWTYIAGRFPPSMFGPYFISLLPVLIGIFIQQSINLIVLGICIAVGGSIVYNYFTRDPRIWRGIVGVVVVLSVWEIAWQTSVILIEPSAPVIPLIVTVIISIAISVIVIAIIFALHRRFTQYFVKG